MANFDNLSESEQQTQSEQVNSFSCKVRGWRDGSCCILFPLQALPKVFENRKRRKTSFSTFCLLFFYWRLFICLMWVRRSYFFREEKKKSNWWAWRTRDNKQVIMFLERFGCRMQDLLGPSALQSFRLGWLHILNFLNDTNTQSAYVYQAPWGLLIHSGTAQVMDILIEKWANFEFKKKLFNKHNK